MILECQHHAPSHGGGFHPVFVHHSSQSGTQDYPAWLFVILILVLIEFLAAFIWIVTRPDPKPKEGHYFCDDCGEEFPIKQNEEQMDAEAEANGVGKGKVVCDECYKNYTKRA